MPKLDAIGFLLVLFLPSVASQLTLSTHADDTCYDDADFTQYITYARSVDVIQFESCETVTHSSYPWNRGQVSCLGQETLFTWYETDCTTPNLRATWKLSDSDANTLFDGGCASTTKGEYVLFNHTNISLARPMCTGTTTTVNTSTTTNTTLPTSTTTTTNTTITPHPPSPWYNPDVPGGNTTTTTTTANNNNLFYYGLIATHYNPGDYVSFQGTHYAPGGEYVFTGVASTVMHAQLIGQTFINVVNQAGFQIGDLILIGQTEMKTITGLSSLLLNAPLQLHHAAGSQVVVLVPSFAAGGGDPVAKFGDVHREFWLPTGNMYPIIRTPDMNIMASTFAGEGKEQWFGHMIITSAGGFKIAEISIKKDLEHFNKSRSAKNAFETLDVSLGTDSAPMEHMPSPDFYFHRMGVAITFMRMSDMKKPIAHQFKIQGARRDVVMIACKTAHFIIAASPASEFANWRPDLSVKYAHLDIIVSEMHDRKALKGIMPELWGIQPMSNRTKSFLEPIYIDDEGESDSPVSSSTESTTTPLQTEPQRFLADKKARSTSNSDVEEDGLPIGSREDSGQIDSCGVSSSTPLPCAT